MKKTTVFLCLFLSVMALHARAIQEEYRLADEKARVSYAVGMIIASNFDLGALGLDLDYDAITEGLRVVTEGKEARFTFQEAIEIVETALIEVVERTADENYLIEQAFLLSNSQQPDVQITPSGLQYVILREAEGEKPQANSVVRVNYTGTFTDGRIFDRSTDENGAFIPLEMVIPGWAESVQLMTVGSIYRFFMPSELAYGRSGIQGMIPPHSTLIFTIELLEIVSEDYDPYYQQEF